MAITPIQKIYEERVNRVRESLQKMQRRDADNLAHELGIGIETVRRIRCGRSDFANPTMKILAPLDAYFIENPVNKG